MISQYDSYIPAFLWAALGLLLIGSIYLIVEGVKVHKLFAESIVGKLIKILVVVVLAQLFSLAIACYAFLFFVPNLAFVLLPVVFLCMICLLFAIVAVKDAKKQVTSL